MLDFTKNIFSISSDIYMSRKKPTKYIRPSEFYNYIALFIIHTKYEYFLMSNIIFKTKQRLHQFKHI